MLDKILIIAIIVIALGGSGIIGTLYVKNLEQKNTILDLNISVDNLKSAIKVKNIQVDSLKESQNQLQNLITEKNKLNEETQKQLEDITNAPEADNGDVANVIRNTIDKL